MEDQLTKEIRYAEDPREFLDFVRKHPGSVACDSTHRRCKGVEATVEGRPVVMYLRLSDIAVHADTLGEETRRLLVSSTGQLVKALSSAP